MMKRSIIIVLAVLLLAGCTQKGETPGSIPPTTIETQTQSTEADTTPEPVPGSESASEPETEAEAKSAIETQFAPKTALETLSETEPTVNPQPETERIVHESADDLTPDLSGNWIQSGWEEKETFMICTIADEIIEISWCMDGGDTVALYWVGTAPNPTEHGDYTWDSINDKERTDFALLASGDDTKTFTYHLDSDEITYSQSAMGMTTTVRLVKYSAE